MPTIMIATISSDVPTGRSMKIRDGFMSRSRLLVGLRGRLLASTAAPLACPLSFTLLSAAPAALAVRRRSGRRALAVYRRRGDRRAGGTRTARRTADLGAVAQ